MATYKGVTGGARYKASQKTYQTDAYGTFETTNLTAGDISSLVEIRADNAAAIEAALDKAMAKALEEMGITAEAYAKKECPVDTGRLRNSITHIVQPGEKAVYIGTNVEYAHPVELGTSRQKAQPFLRPAAEDHVDKYRAIARKNLQNA